MPVYYVLNTTTLRSMFCNNFIFVTYNMILFYTVMCNVIRVVIPIDALKN